MDINNIYKSLANFSFFQIDIIADLELDGIVYKDIKQRNNDSILTLHNWAQHKDIFFNQRMAKHNEIYTLKQKINKELEILSKLPIDNTDYQILKELYQEYLEFGLLPQLTETKTDKLKVPQIALIHFYEGIQITRENAVDIAAKHGYSAKNSGEGLFQDYTYYCSTGNRKGKPTPCTPRKLRNKIELFESVVNQLSDNNKQRAYDEINILKTIFDNEYQYNL